jgi:hypothetical protein
LQVRRDGDGDNNDDDDDDDDDNDDDDNQIRHVAILKSNPVSRNQWKIWASTRAVCNGSLRCCTQWGGGHPDRATGNLLYTQGLLHICT